MQPDKKTSALNRLKTVRGHLDGVIAMVDEERYCPEIMKQVSALQGSLEKVNRVLLENHVETCVLHAVSEGRTADVSILEMLQGDWLFKDNFGGTLRGNVAIAPRLAIRAGVPMPIDYGPHPLGWVPESAR